MALLLEAIAGKAKRPPVWFMRQAGRYHAHYQGMRARFSFEELCKNPQNSVEVALAPVEDFGLDAAILFSDILFIFDCLSCPVSFADGPPKLAFNASTIADLRHYKILSGGANNLSYQYDAMALLREKSPKTVDVLGFVGAPATLLYFATGRSNAKPDGEFCRGFYDLILPLLQDNICKQIAAGADAIMIFDSSASAIVTDFPGYFALLSRLVAGVKEVFAHAKIVYYIKNTPLEYIQVLKNSGFDGIGVDEKINLNDVFTAFNGAIQGNFFNHFTTLPQLECERELERYFIELSKLDVGRRARFINGLSHGVLPETKPGNLRKLIALNHEFFD